MKRWYEHRIPPPVVDLACAGLMWWLASALPALQYWPRGGGGWVGLLVLALVVVGGAIALAGTLAFRRAQTTINPLAPRRTRALVTDGVYRFTRNPMYLGMLLVLAAWAVWLGNLAAFAGLPVSMLVLGVLQVAPEERILHERFGAEYERYRARVRRWL